MKEFPRELHCVAVYDHTSSQWTVYGLEIGIELRVPHFREVFKSIEEALRLMLSQTRGQPIPGPPDQKIRDLWTHSNVSRVIIKIKDT